MFGEVALEVVWSVGGGRGVAEFEAGTARRARRGCEPMAWKI